MLIPVKTQNGKYDIVLERGALKSLGSLCKLERKVLIVTDSGVPGEYAKTAASFCKQPYIVTIPEGEGSKCLDTYVMLLKKMVDAGFTRSDCVIAVGGGVVGDLSGFVAASYMRGVDFYNVPTTLLAQVDSSVGGKVAIDFEGYKNLVGAFYQPKRVIIDSSVLSTLPERQLRNGLAEAIKMAATSDEDLFGLIECGDIMTNIDTIIERSVKIKRDVVEQDEKESGLRKVLNFGHTVAHALESEHEMKDYYHGECVAMGMIPMCSDAVRDRLTALLKKAGLPYEINCDFDTVIKAMRHDKKMSADKITVVYCEKIGSFKMEDIPFDTLVERLRKAGFGK